MLSQLRKSHLQYMRLIIGFLLVLATIYNPQSLLPVVIVTLLICVHLIEIYLYKKEKFLKNLILFSIALIFVYILAWKFLF